MQTVRSVRYAAAALALGVVAAGCAETGSSDQGGDGPSVPLGADQQEYADALADMEPVTLTMQSTAPKGAATGRRFEAYAEAVEEWSDGKITFELAYSNAIAPPNEVDDALADGRIDVGSVIPALEPSEFPETNVLWDASFVSSQEPVRGLLEWHGTMIQTSVETEEIQQEYQEHGMHLLLPTFGSGSLFVTCDDPGASLDDLSGRTIASQSRVQNAEAEALGMTPSTVPYSEMFESLERGVVDCAFSTMTVSTLGGFVSAAPHFSYAPDAGIMSPGGSIAISRDTWESLPLAAQQLLHDRMDVVLEANFAGTWDNIADGLDAIDEAGGSVVQLGSGAEAALQQANDEALDEARNANTALVENLLQAEEEWATVVDELGVGGVDVGYDDFRDWHENTDPDLSAYFAVLGEAMSAGRPS